MGVPVEIDVVRYVTAEEEGDTAAEARRKAALDPDNAEVPETDEVAPVVTIDFEGINVLPSETVEREMSRDKAFR